MKSIVFTFLFSCLIVFTAFAQTDMLGLSRNGVIEAQKVSLETHNLKESVTNLGEPYLLYTLKEGAGGITFFFENDLCVEYKVVLLESDASLFMEDLRQKGYVFGAGAWFNKDAQKLAIVKKEGMIISASFMTFDYYLSTYGDK